MITIKSMHSSDGKSMMRSRLRISKCWLEGVCGRFNGAYRILKTYLALGSQSGWESIAR